MISCSYFVVSEKWEKVPKVFREFPKKSHRPKKKYFLKIESREDALTVKKSGIPLLWVDEEQSLFWNYPMRFPSFLIVPRELRNAVKGSVKKKFWQSLRPFETESVYPRIEDFIVFMLDFDLIAAFALMERNTELIDFYYLKKRIYEEQLEEQASKIHFSEFIEFKERGEKLPFTQLKKAASKNYVRAIL